MTITYETLKKPEGKHGLKDEQLFNETRRAEDILKTMHEETYEELVTAWAFWCLKEDGKSKYEDVLHIGGAGDKGVDVIAFVDQKTKKCDIYQCKHYNHPINRSDIIGEIGKFLYFMWKGEIAIPESYYLMGPEGMSGLFTHIYTDPNKLKKAIQDSWMKDIAGNIEKGKIHSLEGELETFVESFDYTKFKVYSVNRFLKDLLDCKMRFVYFQYFGFHKEYMHRIKKPTPTELDEYERKYIGHLLAAYNDVDGVSGIDEESVKSSEFAGHYNRSRDEFWLAESVKKMDEENSPGDKDEFEELKDDMEDYVADTYEQTYKDANQRMRAVTDKSTSMPKKDRIISSELGVRELKGVCFQLSNEDRLIWKDEKC